MHRRTYLESVGAATVGVAIAGCTAGGDEADGDANIGGADGETRTPRRFTAVDDYVSIREDKYRYWTFNLTATARVSVDLLVRSGPDVDYFLTTQSEFNQFQGGNRFEYYTSVSGAGTSLDSSTTLGDGSYVYVVDNTDEGQVAPPSNFDDDVAEVEITVKGEEIL